MRRYVVEGRVFHEITVETDGTYEDAVDAFRQQFGGMPDTINDRAVVGMCEDCGGVLFETSAYNEDSEGVKWHRSPHDALQSRPCPRRRRA